MRAYIQEKDGEIIIELQPDNERENSLIASIGSIKPPIEKTTHNHYNHSKEFWLKLTAVKK